MYPIPWTINLLYNFLSKAKDLVNPLFYSSKLRIIKKIHGKVRFESKRRAIFVIYQKDDISFCINNVLQTLELLKINCTVNVNRELAHDKIKQIADKCDLVLVRKNFGSDFAAYKDSILLTNLKELDKLIILNDSMFYCQKGLKNIFEELLDNNNDVVGITESTYKKWHVQSFLISLSKDVILSKGFLRYWRKYKCFNNRQHVIKNGEILFSQNVLKPYYSKTKIIYSLDSVINAIQESTLSEIASLMDLLPRQNLHDINKDKNGTKKTFIADTAYILADVLERSNVTHTGAFIFPKLSNSIILKKDIHYRMSFNLYDISRGLIFIGATEAECLDILKHIKLKGSVKQYGLIYYLLTLLGIK